VGTVKDQSWKSGEVGVANDKIEGGKKWYSRAMPLIPVGGVTRSGRGL